MTSTSLKDIHELLHGFQKSQVKSILNCNEHKQAKLLMFCYKFNKPTLFLSFDNLKLPVQYCY